MKIVSQNNTGAVASERANVTDFLGRASAEIGRNRLTFAVLGLMVLISAFYATAEGTDIFEYYLKYFKRAVRAIILLGSVHIVYLGVKTLLGDKSEGLVKAFTDQLRSTLTAGFVWRFVIACLLFTVFMAAFLFFKTKIPVWNPYSWDEPLAQLDAAILGGQQAWEVLHPVFGYPLVTKIIDFLYMIWVPMVFLFWAISFASDRIESGQYWLATVLGWTVAGVGLATYFSSVGPCYYHKFATTDPELYRPLMEYISGLTASDGTPIFARRAQTMLWGYHIGLHDRIGGISAMPSMHNLQAVLFACVAFRVNRVLGWIMAFYALMIFIGSIHLGWHYATDSLFGCLLGLVFWKLAGLLAPINNPGHKNRTVTA